MCRGGSAIAPGGVLHTQIRALRPGSVPCDYYSWAPRANELNEEENPPGICSETRKDGLDEQISVCESQRGERRRNACDAKTRRRRRNEIKARSVKPAKSAGAAPVFTFFLLPIPERMSRDGGASVRTEHQCTPPLSSLTTSAGGFGLLWMPSETFQRRLESSRSSSRFREMKHLVEPVL